MKSDHLPYCKEENYTVQKSYRGSGMNLVKNVHAQKFTSVFTGQLLVKGLYKNQNLRPGEQIMKIHIIVTLKKAFLISRYQVIVS